MALKALGKINKIEIYAIAIPFIRPFKIASGPYGDKAEYALVRLQTSEGVEGWGEASPVPAFSKIGQEEVLKELNAVAELLKNQELNVNMLHKRIRVLNTSISSYALCGFETAILDAIGKTLDIPIYQLLGGKVRNELELAWPIGLADVDHVLLEAKEAVDKGFKEIKLKVGEDLLKDIERIRAIREEFPSIEIRVDANQGYDRMTAIKASEAFSRLGVRIFEQPVSKLDIEGLKAMRRCGMKVMADESCSSLEDAYTLLKAEAVDIINIKIMKYGGLKGALEIASISKSAKIGNSLGSMLETGIGTAAGLHFAMICENIQLRGEIVGPLFLEDDLLEDPLPYTSGKLLSLTKPGLGVEVNLKSLHEYGELVNSF